VSRSRSLWIARDAIRRTLRLSGERCRIDSLGPCPPSDGRGVLIGIRDRFKAVRYRADVRDT